jgi:hypothetical protein
VRLEFLGDLGRHRYGADLVALGQGEDQLVPYDPYLPFDTDIQPGDVNNQGEPVWYSGVKLAPDLSINRIRERLAAQEAPDRPTASTTRPANPWHTATETVDGIPAILNGEDDAAAQAQLAAFGELLDATATITTGPTKTELRAAAKAFEHAPRSKIRAAHQHASHLRHAAKQLFRTTSQGDGEGIAILLSSLVLVAIAAANWHKARHHEQQTAATHQALIHLQAAHDHAASRPLADLARRTPPPEIARRYESALRQAVPDQAARILADPTWPALTTALSDADDSGHKSTPLLKKAAELQELDTAKCARDVLIGEARRKLRAGATAVGVFAELAERTADWHASALAVCLALGIPDCEAKRQLREGPAELYRRFHPGEETECGELLEMIGVFDVRRPLDAHGEEIRRFLEAAISAMGDLRSGHALGLSRRLVTGQLTSAFLSLARVGPRPHRGSAAEYWAALVAAGELLDPGDSEGGRNVEEALDDCRRHAAESQREPTADKLEDAQRSAIRQALGPSQPFGLPGNQEPGEPIPSQL